MIQDAMSSTNTLYEIIWDESLWFPVGVNGEKFGWKDLQNKPGSSEHYPEASDLHFGIVLGVLLVLFRYVLERFVIIPLGFRLGIPRKKKIYLKENPVLEVRYKQCRKNRGVVDDTTCMELSKQLDLPLRQVQTWFRKRKKVDTPAPIDKFCNNSWHLLYYTFAFIYGTVVLWTKPWLWKTRECWTNWPHQPIANDLYWYYVIEFAFYWSLVITVFTDHKRKDFNEMIIHHAATLTLIYCSWVVNWVRLGSLVIFLHDASDPWLALSKMGIYLKIKQLKFVAFFMFVSVWFISRLIYFPFWILNNTVVELPTFFSSPGLIHCICNGFQFLLLILNLMWSYRLYKMLYSTLAGGQPEDSRSDTEDDVSDDENDNHEKNNYVNGKHHSPIANGHH